MGEFDIHRSADDHWDLQAIVKGCNTSKCQENEATQLLQINKHKILGLYDHTGPQEITKPRRRQSKHKMNVVQQVAGDRILSDKWNWRKYGQKIIKGSPYPRSYYKCSNSGGCIARKQVEHSNTDPGTFLISYIGEHNHPYPTRHHSQAGRTKERFDTSSKALATGELSATASTTSTQTITSSLEDHDPVLALQRDKDEERLEDTGREGGEGVDAPNLNMVLNDDDIFDGLDYLEGLEMDLLFDGLSFDPFPSSI